MGVALGLALSTGSVGVQGQTPEADLAAFVQKLDRLYYSPKTEGLRSLTCRVDWPLLTDLVRQMGGAAVTPTFAFSWKAPNREEFTVEGLPAGMQRISSQILAMLKDRGGMIVPRPPSEFLADFDLALQPSPQGKVVLAGRAKGPEAGAESVRMTYTTEGVLQEMAMSQAGQTMTATLTPTRHDGKLLPGTMVARAPQMQVETAFTYGKQDGFWLIQSATITYRDSAGKPLETGQANPTTMRFVEYEINADPPASGAP